MEKTFNAKEQFKKQTGPEKNISYRQFMRFRFGWGQKDICFTTRNSTHFKPKETCYHWLWTFRRLAEYFILSVVSRIERLELEYTKLNQQNLRSILSKDYVNAISAGLTREGKTLGKVFQLPQTFKGSNKYYEKCYADFMTIVRRLGNPTWLVF
jgi:hypothetical protein